MNLRFFFMFAVIIGLFAFTSAYPNPDPEPEPEPEPEAMADPRVKWKHIRRGLDVADAAANIAGVWWG
ncbi:hypothetical protein HHI36_012605 [Cryptolaemus montrouzieri]|uniref:Uncharacterized protein n=1 Tax=Cryptolaemus montrouzieri TaxID=559131 RepID=A0ABD2NFB7_9CUCU